MKESGLRKSFDHLAPVYRLLEYLTMGRALEQVRCRHLADLVDQRRVLIIGEGDGRFLELLLQHNRCGEITVVERSQKMVALCRQRINAHARTRNVEFLIRDAPQACAMLRQRGERFDAIVTLFVLDCFQGRELDTLTQQLAELLRPGGLWVYGDFSIPSSPIARILATAWIGCLYHVFGWVTDIRAQRLESPDPWLRNLHLEPLTERLYNLGMLRAALWRRPTSERPNAVTGAQLGDQQKETERSSA